MPGIWQVSGGGGGGGAPVTATYITDADETATLANSERLSTKVILAPGLLAARPAANTVAVGAIYNATDTSLVYRSTGAAWVALTIGTVGAVIAPITSVDGTVTVTGTTSADLSVPGVSLLAIIERQYFK